MKLRTFCVRTGLLLMLQGLSGCVTTPETGKTAVIITSEQEENQLGLQAYQQILAKERQSGDARMSEILQRVGSRIAQAANKPSYRWEFKLIESKEKNAFCLPGGKVAVYTGILPYMKNEAGLATVIGHEVAHATARHGGQRMTTAFGTQVLIAGLSQWLGGGGGPQRQKMVLAALGVGSAVAVTLPFSRSNESEADEIGLIYMARAGYDPREAAQFWSRFGGEEKGAPAFLSTHPTSESRKNALASQASKVWNLYQSSPQYGLGETL